MEKIKKFINSKYIYLVMGLSFVIIVVTVIIVGMRDYNDLISAEIAEPISAQEVKIEEPIQGEIIANIDEFESFEEPIIEDIKSDVKQKDIEIANEKENLFIYPIQGSIIKEYFDDELVYSKTLKEWGYHKGIDIKADKGTQVKVIGDGVIDTITEDALYGTTIIVSHKDGFKSVYSNLSTANMVKVGDSVKKGQIISGVGESSIIEAEDEPHLHFELLKEDENINPLEYLK